MWNVLIGGMITLVVTAVVQIFVIPEVQRRTRALDRWEKDVVTLMTLVNEELLEKISQFAIVTFTVYGKETQRVQPDDLFEAHANVFNLPDPREEVHVAEAELRDVLTKISFTLRRCALVAPRSGYWAMLFNQVQAVWTQQRRFPMLTRDLATSARTGELDDAIAKIQVAQDELSKTLREITEPIRPPKQPSRWDGWRAQRQLKRTQIK